MGGVTLEQNKAIAERFIQEVFVQGNEAAADELAAPDFTPHSWGEMPPGVESLKAAQRRVMAGLSDARMTIEDVIGEGDKVAVRLTSHGRHSGEFMGMPPSNREYTISEIHIFRIEDGKVAEHWRDADMLGLMQQIGAKADESEMRRAS
jgi:predicted ester cyclase